MLKSGMNKKFYITCAIPYTNARPHAGHAFEFVLGDALARYHRLLGEDVVLLSGGDENALKNVQAAETAGEKIQEFVDKNNSLFVELAKKLNCQFDVWQKGSDKEKHFPSSQELWKLCDKAGDIYQKEYSGLYCVGCEAFYAPGELNENGECFEHPGKKLQEVKETNYFFKLSKYQNQIEDLIRSNTLKIHPEERKNEVLSFLKEPLQDISISRSNERARNWGVPVPGDDEQKIYVWFDALQIYATGVGFGWNNDKYKKYWPADIHVIGKGITRFHAIYWPAFLFSAGLKLPHSLFVHGYFTVNGQKMSKTLGNVIDPNEIISKYGADALRYYFLAKFSPFTDGDFSEEKLKDVYNGDLANGLGNVVSRVAKLAENSGFSFPIKLDNEIYRDEQKKAIEELRFDNALSNIWNVDASSIDKHLNQEQPWIQTGEKLKKTLQYEIDQIRLLARKLSPFLPETATKISEQFANERIKSSEPLFPRIK